MFGSQRKVTKHIQILDIEDQHRKEVEGLLRAMGIDLEKEIKLRITLENWLKSNHALRVMQER